MLLSNLQLTDAARLLDGIQQLQNRPAAYVQSMIQGAFDIQQAAERSADPDYPLLGVKSPEFITHGLETELEGYTTQRAAT